MASKQVQAILLKTNFSPTNRSGRRIYKEVIRRDEFHPVKGLSSGKDGKLRQK